jgi:hypothetical protein
MGVRFCFVKGRKRKKKGKSEKVEEKKEEKNANDKRSEMRLLSPISSRSFPF